MNLVIPVVAIFLMAMAARLRHPEMTATAGVLVANWAVNAAFCWAMGDPSPWLVFMIVDYLSAMAVFVVMCSRWQMIVIGTFAIMEVIHAGYGRSLQDEWAGYVYWWALFWVALAQVGLMGGWMASEMVRRRSSAMVRSRSLVAFEREVEKP